MADVLRADIVGRDMGASAALRGYAREADVAAETTRRLAEAQAAQRRASMASAAATIASAKADKILEDASDDAIRASVEQRIATEKLAKSSKDAAGAGGIGALVGGTGAGGGGMGALIGAAVALSPVIATVGVGLLGVGAAAYGIAKPIENAAQKTGGLQANMAKLNPEQQRVAQGLLGLGRDFGVFQKQMQPAVFKIFNQGLGVARTLLHGTEPVALATGKALGGVLGEVGKEFRSGEWQQFFGFMARTAAPDVRLLGDTFTQLLGTLPGLLQDLQPLGRGILVVADDAAKAMHSVTGFYSAFQRNVPISTQHTFNFLRDLDHWTVSLTNHLPGGRAINRWLSGVQGNASGAGVAAGQAAAGFKDMGDTAAVAGPKFFALNKTVRQLNHDMTKLVGNLLTLQGGELGWQSAIQSANAQLRSNTAGLEGNSKNAIANRQAVLGTTNAAISFAAQQLTLGKNISGASRTVQAQIKWLQSLHDKSQFVRSELQALRKEERLLQEQRINQIIHVQGLGQWQVSQSLAPGTGHRRAAGGLLRGPGTATSDSIPVWASAGEYMVKAAAVSKYGAGLFDKLNAMQLAGGGLIPSYSGSPAMAGWVKQDDKATIRLIDQAVVKATVAGMRAAQSAASGGFGGHGVPPSGPIQSYARRLVGAVWPGLGEWLAFADIVARESGWNPFATNPSSGAYGIPQALPGSKMASAGADWRTNPFTQLRWMVGYIAQRWRDPIGADFNERSAHWYGGGLRGGVFRQPQLIGVGDTPERVDITPLGRGRSGGGALVHVDTMVVQDATDVQLVSRQLDFLLTSASLGT